MDYPKWKDNGKIKLIIIIGTRPEIIRLAAVIKKCRKYFDTILIHTGQNYDYNLNGVFFKDLGLAGPELYLDVAGTDLGETMGNIIAASYRAMAEMKPDAVLVLGDTNSCLSVISAKRLHIPIFHMEAGNRCKDECLPEETKDCGYYFRCQSGIFRARTSLPCGLWSAKRAYLCYGFAHGRSVDG